MSGFDFSGVDAVEDGQELEFTFGAQEELQEKPKDIAVVIKKEQPRRIVPQSRVIGGGHRKKVNKFAKKCETQPQAKPQPPQPIQPVQQPEVTVEPQVENQESAFNFGDVAQAQDETAFSFGDAEVIEDNQEEAFTFGENAEEQPKEEEILQVTKCADLADIFLECHQKAVESFTSKEAIMQQINKLENELQIATQEEEFSRADEISTQLAQLHEEFDQKSTSYSEYISKSMETAATVPQQIQKNNERDLIQLPTLQSTRDKLTTDLEQLNKDQAEETEKLDQERENVKDQIFELEANLEKHQSEFDSMKSNLEADVNETTSPFEEKIQNLEQEDKDYQSQIQDLQAQIQALNQKRHKCQEQIAEQDKLKKNALAKFGDRYSKLKLEEKKLSQHKNEHQRKVHEIEKPFKGIEESVNRRGRIIEMKQTKLNDTIETITRIESDTKLNEEALTIVGQLNQKFENYSMQRYDLDSQLDSAKYRLNQANSEIEANNAEIAGIISMKEQANEFIADAKIKIPKLEVSKKNFVKSKNFKSAQQLADQVKELNEQIQKHEAALQDSDSVIQEKTDCIDKLEKEKTEVEIEITQITSKISAFESEFYEESIRTMEQLFDASEFCKTKLAPLRDLFQFALEHTEKEEDVPLEELEARLESLTAEFDDACQNDEYIKAEEIQKKIDITNAKIAAIKASQTE